MAEVPAQGTSAVKTITKEQGFQHTYISECFEYKNMNGVIGLNVNIYTFIGINAKCHGLCLPAGVYLLGRTVSPVWCTVCTFLLTASLASSSACKALA